MADKLFYIANIRLPTEKAHGIQIMKMCEAFAKAGFEAELLITNRNTPLSEDPFSYYKVPRVFRLTQLPCLDTVRAGKWGYRLSLLSFAFSVVVKTLFKRGVFYSRDEFLALVLFMMGKRVVLEMHMGHQGMFTKTLIRLGVRLVVISRGLEEAYVKLGAKRENILVAPDAVDLEMFKVSISQDEARRKLGLASCEKVVAYIGLLDGWKGHDTLLKASRAFDPAVTTVLVGDSNELEELRRAYPKAVFTGNKPYHELPHNQRAADILVIPNSAKYDLSKYFTSPLKLFTYMTTGIPIVASDIPSLREIVDESMVSFFEPDNPESLAASVAGVFENYEEAKTKAAKAREIVKRYSWINRAESITSFINVIS